MLASLIFQVMLKFVTLVPNHCLVMVCGYRQYITCKTLYHMSHKIAAPDCDGLNISVWPLVAVEPLGPATDSPEKREVGLEHLLVGLWSTPGILDIEIDPCRVQMLRQFYLSTVCIPCGSMASASGYAHPHHTCKDMFHMLRRIHWNPRSLSIRFPLVLNSCSSLLCGIQLSVIYFNIVT